MKIPGLLVLLVFVKINIVFGGAVNIVNAYIDSCWENMGLNLGRANAYADTAIKLARPLNEPLLMATSLNAKGYVLLLRDGASQNSKEYFSKALKIRQQFGDSAQCKAVENNLGLWYMNFGQLDTAVFLLQNVVSFYERKQSTLAMLEAKRNLATCYHKQGAFKESTELLRDNINWGRSQSDSNEVCVSIMNIGYVLEEQMRYRDLIKNARNALTWLPKRLETNVLASKIWLLLGNGHLHLGNLDSAKLYYQKTYDIGKGCDDEQMVNNALQNLSRIDRRQGEFDLARKKLLKVLGYWEEKSDVYNIALSHLDLARLYVITQKPDSALIHLKKGRWLVEKTEKLFLKMDYERVYSQAYGQLGQFDSAYYHETRSGLLQDSLQRVLSKSIQWELEQSKKDERIRTLQVENLEKENERMNLIIIVVISILIILALVASLVILKLRSKTKLAEKERQIDRQKVDELLKNQELSSIMNVLEIQEKERKRIAQDLHDRLGSMLSMVKLHFKNTEKNLEQLKQQNKDEYEKASKLLDEACDEVRKIAHNLISGVLRKFGLVAALNDLGHTVEQSGQLTMEVVTTGLDERLGWDYELNIYRVIQELLANTMKHAEATEVTIQLLRNNGNLRVIYEDDGRGFDDSKIQLGMGMKNIASRLDKLGSALQTDSGKGGGSTFMFNVSIKDHDKGFIS